MFSLESRPRLAPKVRLRYDRKTTRYMLLYPERGLVLNATAADVAQLCTGEHTVGAIVEQLAARYGQAAGVVEREVLAFLAAMAERGLVRDAGVSPPAIDRDPHDTRLAAPPPEVPP